MKLFKISCLVVVINFNILMGTIVIIIIRSLKATSKSSRDEKEIIRKI